ncbi:pheromone A receptor-domain-containing protein [Melanogaster broomeanus]|nr:pheromone A receptor-domain-containing protein [Melanogaster broomeanus]
MLQDPYPLYPIFAFLGFVLTLVPLPWHFQAWNSGTCAYMLWVSLSCLVQFVNSVVWQGNVNNPAPVWCDISTKFLIGASVGIPASGMCITRRLYKISCVSSVTITRRDKRRAVFIDLCFCLGIPILVMALRECLHVVPRHRFDILEDVGCYPSIYNTLPAYFCVFMWPVVIGCASFVYSALTLVAFYKRRLQFNELMSSHTSLNTSRYLRLMLLATLEMLCTIPIGIYSMYIANVGVPLEPYISWANVHWGFSYVGLIPALEWATDPGFRISVEMTRWLFPACAFLFFALFGFAGEARKNYTALFLKVSSLLGYKPKPAWSPTGAYTANKAVPGALASAGSLPAYVPRTTAPEKRYVESLDLSIAEWDYDLEKSDVSLPSPLVVICIRQRDRERTIPPRRYARSHLI